jgi:hypothetical protein
VDDAALAGIRAKLARADEQLDRLDDELAVFAEQHPYDFRGDVEPDAGRWAAYFILKKPLPVELSVTVGDIVHNLRSALDHIAYALVPDPTRRTNFPIFDEPDDFFCAVKLPAKRNRGPLAGLDPESPAFALIEGAQPYMGGHPPDTDPLRILSALNNEDKHRAIVACNTALTEEPSPEAAIVGMKDVEVADEYTIHVNRALKNDTEIMFCEVTITGDDPEVQVGYEFHFAIAFGKHPVTPSDLRFIRDAVSNVIETAAQLPS